MRTENENIILGEDISDIRDRGEYSSIFCQCGQTVYFKTPKIKTWRLIKCPKCGNVYHAVWINNNKEE